MKTIQIIFILSCLFFGRAALAEDPLNFAKSAYGNLATHDGAAQTYQQEALTRFKAQFDFDTFAHRAMQDIEPKLDTVQIEKLKQTFSALFFGKFAAKSGGFSARKLQSPIFTQLNSGLGETLVKITGLSRGEHMSITLHVVTETDGTFHVCDLDFDSATLSRNYRGAFNRMFREHGFDGLM